jgi:hypothetical protein
MFPWLCENLDGEPAPLCGFVLLSGRIENDLGERTVKSLPVERAPARPKLKRFCNATLITSQFLVDKWPEFVAEPIFADAILDRLIDNVYRPVQTDLGLSQLADNL